MIYKENDIYEQHIKPQTITWGCHFEHTYSKENVHFFQKPVKGMLTCENKLSEEEYAITHPECWDNTAKTYGELTPQYFVPFKKTAKTCTLNDLAWSNAVKLNARIYATTEKESIDAYNNMVIATIRHILRIAKNDAKCMIGDNIPDDVKKSLDELETLKINYIP